MSVTSPPGPLRRIAAIVGIAGAVGLGAYGASMVAAGAQSPPPPSTADPAVPGPTDDDRDCGDKKGVEEQDQSPSAAPSSPAV